MYDFDNLPERRGTDCLKWDVDKNALPMWVADMDFAAAPPIREAIERRAKQGVFGYSIIPERWSEAYVEWWKTRHGFTMEKENLIFCTGTIPAISSLVRKLTTPAEKVVVMTPVYNIFFNSILNNGRVVSEVSLPYEEGRFSLDLAALEKAMEDPQATLLILCNPQNPTGQIWDRATLARIGEMAEKHHVTVISDEIHCDITDPGKEYVPFASVSETCRRISITCLAPSKAFNLAGLQSAAVYVSDEGLRNRVNRSLNTDEVAEPNAFAVDAAVAAFTEGGSWLDELRKYLYENKLCVKSFLEKELRSIHLAEGEATYLLWLDVSAVAGEGKRFAVHLRKEEGLFVSSGDIYGGVGKQFIRLNIATSRANVEEGLRRLKKGAEAFAVNEWIERR